VRNLGQLILGQGDRRGDALWGNQDDLQPLRTLIGRGARVAGELAADGLRPGDRVAMLGQSSSGFLATWIGMQLGGFVPALINPSYPRELVDRMLADLRPALVVPAAEIATAAEHSPVPWDEVRRSTWPGAARDDLDLAGYMHTSGTSGTPKFCAQSHAYFLRLGSFVADRFCLSADDVVYTPLPLFHVNPLGYAVIGALCGSARAVSGTFSASGYWSTVRELGATVLMLHTPPVEILKRGDPTAAGPHRVRLAFLVDAEFQERFKVPLAVSAYGSTESAGITHSWLWREGEETRTQGGNSRYGGRAREDTEWRLADDGEILIRGREPGTLISGYLRAGELEPLPSEEGGWFATGDLGEKDELGNLVFLERKAESIRVKGEYVPIPYVEERFARLVGVDEVALWRRSDDLVDHEVVLYVAGDPLVADAFTAVAAELPRFMRPALVRRLDSLPRDDAVGKVRRRELAGLPVREEIELRAS
jgi:acyl-CoA synthetase (AMP-forming)/AMP-acid ligase II